MIRLLLQHVIFEACIEQVFDGLNRNFGWLNWNIKIQSVGDCVRLRVSGLKHEVILSKCVVESKVDNTMVIRSEDHPRHIWIDVNDGKITNIRGDEKAIADIFMPDYN